MLDLLGKGQRSIPVISCMEATISKTRCLQEVKFPAICRYLPSFLCRDYAYANLVRAEAKMHYV